MIVKAIIGSNGEIIEGLEDRIQGRFVAEDVKDKEGNLIVAQNCFVDDAIAKKIIAAGIADIFIFFYI